MPAYLNIPYNQLPVHAIYNVIYNVHNIGTEQLLYAALYML